MSKVRRELSQVLFRFSEFKKALVHLTQAAIKQAFHTGIMRKGQNIIIPSISSRTLMGCFKVRPIPATAT